jgi:transposase-like protein
MRTNHRTQDVEALRAGLAARLPSPPPEASPRHDELEQRCRLYLQQLRWPGGVECPRCEESDRLLWLEARDKWHCYSCRYQFSVTAGTLFHSSHLPLWKWFVSVQLMTETPRGVSANRLRHVLGGSYKTFWFTTHRIRVAMRGRGQPILRTVVGDLAERRRIAGPYHHLSDKYLDAYLEERRWLAENQGNPHVFRDTILALVRGEGLSYDQLVAPR